RPASLPAVEIDRRAGASCRGTPERYRRRRRAMTALAQPPAGVLVRGAAFSRSALPTLLLLPCLIWISFFFLLPLGLMCWRSLASEGFSLETYSVLFTSPLYTKVMLTTVRTAAIATIFALLLAYPLAYVLTISS